METCTLALWSELHCHFLIFEVTPPPPGRHPPDRYPPDRQPLSIHSQADTPAHTTLDRHPLGRQPRTDTPSRLPPPGRHPPDRYPSQTDTPRQTTSKQTPPGRHPGTHYPRQTPSRQTTLGRHPPPPPGKHHPRQTPSRQTTLGRQPQADTPKVDTFCPSTTLYNQQAGSRHPTELYLLHSRESGIFLKYCRIALILFLCKIHQYQSHPWNLWNKDLILDYKDWYNCP